MKDLNYRAKKKPWPTKDAMEQVYTNNLWGDNDTDFYSGEGSHLSSLVIPYIEVVTSFFKSFKEPLVVCDLGCGDFNVGIKIVPYTKQYVAVDIVPDLISFNSKEFNQNNLAFQCLDIAEDNLPLGDCAIVRQVLQHLSNAEVVNVVNKLTQYKYVILTEHLPEGNFIANVDIISGQGIRLKKNSGINLLESPFNLQVKEQKQLLAIKSAKGEVVTTLYELEDNQKGML